MTEENQPNKPDYDFEPVTDPRDWSARQEKRN